jgi:mannose-6-phosphate isomerase
MSQVETKTMPKPWGFELLFARTDRYVGKLLSINKGEALSRQYHRVKDETIYVLEGRLRLELGASKDATVQVLEKGESFHVTPGTIHRFVADEDVLLVEVSTPELDDVVRLEDRYGRAPEDS